jgi:hypothetical protein
VGEATDRQIVPGEAKEGVVSELGRAPGLYRFPSSSRQPLQNKQCFHSLYAYLSAARNRDDYYVLAPTNAP